MTPLEKIIYTLLYAYVGLGIGYVLRKTLTRVRK